MSGVISVQTQMSYCGVRGQFHDSWSFGLLKILPFGGRKKKWFLNRQYSFFSTITPGQETDKFFYSGLSRLVDFLQASPIGSAWPVCVLKLHRASSDGNNSTSNVGYFYQALLAVVWLCYTVLCSGFYGHDINSNGFVLLSLLCSSLLSSSWIFSSFILPSEPSNFCRNLFRFELTVLNNPLGADSLLGAYGWYSLSRDKIRENLTN